MKLKKVAHYGRSRDHKQVQIGDVIEIDGNEVPLGFELIEEPKLKKAPKKESKTEEVMKLPKEEIS